MSTTTSDRAEVLIAHAIVREAAASAGHRRLHFARHLDLEPEGIFRALLGDADKNLRIQGSDEQLFAIDAAGVLLIPYLVTPANEAGQNQGSQGYAAWLRSHFASGATSGEKRALLVLDARPVETVSTASEDVARLPHLQWKALCQQAISNVPAVVETLFNALAEECSKHAIPGKATLQRLVAFAEQPWDNEQVVGERLHELGLHLRDPLVQRNIRVRLKDGREWRNKLEMWHQPGNDLRQSMQRALGGDVRGVHAVLASRRPFGIDYASFTLDDLRSTDPVAPAFARPLIARGPEAFVKADDDRHSSRVTPRLIAWYSQSGGELALRIAGEFEGSESAEIHWSDGRNTTMQLDTSAMEAYAPVAHEGWRFGTASIERGPDAFDRVSVAILVDSGTWFPVEQGLLIDLDQQSFVVEAEPSGLAIARGGGILGPVALDYAPTDPGDRVVAQASSADGEQHPLPLLLLGEGTEGPDDEDQSGTGDATQDEDEDDNSGSGGDGDSSARGSAVSPLHAQIDYTERNHAPGDITFQAGDGKGYITVSGDIYSLEDQLVGGLDGLAIEREILVEPNTWAFTAVAAGEGVEVLPDMTLERLTLGSIGADATNEFAEARAAFFQACSAFGSVYSLGAGIADGEARAYVRAFSRMLSEVPDEGRYQAEFDRLLLMDSVTVPGTGEVYLAPSNPLTVAFYLALRGRIQDWTANGDTLPASDVAAISPAYLMPLVMKRGTWYEVTTPAPFLWRRFRPLKPMGTVSANEGRAMAARLAFFLDVYEAYDDPKQTLQLAVYEPGDGAAVVDALRRFYARELGAETYSKPRLSITLVNKDGRLPAAIHDLLADDEKALDRLIRSRVKIASRPVDEGFNHITFVFRTQASLAPVEVDLRDRSTTLYTEALASSPGRHYQPGANILSFVSGTFAASTGTTATGSPDDVGALVRKTLQLVGGQPNALMAPDQTRMAGMEIERGFMPDIYSRSVWVVHLDHLLGLEAFSTDGTSPTRYLIDYDERPDSARTGLSAVTATERVDPYLDALTAALGELGPLTGNALTRILRLLNSVSGRWALQLLRQARAQILERIGTVTAIAAIQELDAAFTTPGGIGALVPIDELLRLLPRGRGGGQTRICDDLLYLWIPNSAAGRKLLIHGRVLEIKYRTRGRPDLGEARQEIENTHEWLTATFNTNAPDRLFRARDLAEVIRSSVSRSIAFGLMPAVGTDERRALEAALDRVVSGDYSLDLEYWIGSERLIGDVVSVEVESDAGVTRSDLPGAGSPAGLIRLGRGALTALASGQPIPVPESWDPPAFTSPEDGGGAHVPGSSDDGPDGSDGGGDVGGGLEQDQSASETVDITRPARRELSEDEANEVRRLARSLDAAVLKYGLELEPFQPSLAQVGPSVIRFRARPLGRQSLEGVSRRAADLGREIGAAEGVLVAQEPFFITIDVPRPEREVINFSAYSHLLSEGEPGALNFLVGMAASGEVTVADLARLPHLLVAGATGSGKSVFLRSLLCSLLEQNGALELSILLVDPKQIDFLPFEDLPHLVEGRIIYDPTEAVTLLGDTIDREIARRRPVLKSAGVTSVLEFYENGGTRHELPQMVIVVDEFADLASTLGRGERAEFMSLIQRYGQLTRAFGIYLVLATQRPSVQVITGDIKANLTARVALKVQAPQDSVTILGHGGAEALRDKGDLLFEHAGRSERLQGFMVSPRDVASAVGRWNRP